MNKMENFTIKLTRFDFCEEISMTRLNSCLAKLLYIIIIEGIPENLLKSHEKLDST